MSTITFYTVDTLRPDVVEIISTVVATTIEYCIFDNQQNKISVKTPDGLSVFDKANEVLPVVISYGGFLKLGNYYVHIKSITKGVFQSFKYFVHLSDGTILNVTPEEYQTVIKQISDM